MNLEFIKCDHCGATVALDYQISEDYETIQHLCGSCLAQYLESNDDGDLI